MTPEKAAERIIAGYEETNRLLPLAGGIPQPIEQSTDHAVVVALAYRELLKEDAATEADRDRLLAAAKYVVERHNERGFHESRGDFDGCADLLAAAIDGR